MEIKIFKEDGKLLLKEEIKKTKQVINIKKETILFCKDKLIVKFKIPIIDVHGYWTPDIFLPKMTLDWVINLNSAFQKNFPYISFFNQAHRNRFTFGSTNLIDDSTLIAKMNQEEGTYDIEFVISIDKEINDFKLFFDLSDKYWPEIIDDYRKIVQLKEISFPENAYLPVYCSWYVFHADFNQKKLEEQIKIAGELGFGTFIVDDGWCFDDCKRVNPETIKNWYENIGDWEISRKKFNDFEKHLNYVHKNGLKYIVWVAPFIIGPKSKLYKETKCSYLSKEHEGYRIIDPEDKIAINKIKENILKVFEEYKFDGLKIDFIDTINPSLEEPKGRVIYNFVKNFINEIRKINPSALIEFRAKYATPITLNYATQFRAGDVPFDFLGNLYRIAHLHLCVGDKVPIHSDPAYWRFDELDVNVARHMIVCLTGVPMLSMDLKKMNDNHKKIVKNYINFYKKNIEIFKNGNWKIKYEFENIAYVLVKHKNKKICFIQDEKNIYEILESEKGKIFFLNLGNKIIKVKDCISYDFFGRYYKKGFIPVGGMGEIGKE